MQDLISILIVNYNGSKWLPKCLNSLRNQNYKNIEIILVDNASADESVSYCQIQFPHTQIIKNTKNYGFARGVNIGIDHAQGEYILLINNDTWVEHDFLTKLYDCYIKNKYDVVAPIEAAYDGSKRPRYRTLIDLLGHPVYLKSSQKEQAPSFYLSGVCLFFLQKLYRETGGLDDDFFMYFEELDWFWRLQLLQKKISYAPDIYIYHVGAASTGNGLKYRSFLWRNQNTLQMLLKNYSLGNLLWVLPLYFLQNIVECTCFLALLRPALALSYPLGWLYNMRLLSKTFKKRKQIQHIRQITDRAIIKKMYHGSGKLKHLLDYIRR